MTRFRIRLWVAGVTSLAALPSVAADEGSAATIVENLTSESAAIRSHAARQIRVRYEEATPESVGRALVAAAATERDRDAHVDMMCALGRTREPNARAMLEQHLRSPDYALRQCARTGLEEWLSLNGEADGQPSIAYATTPRVPEGFVAETNHTWPWFYTGVGLATAGYVQAAITSALVLEEFKGGWRGREAWGLAFLPLVGPWIPLVVVTREPAADASGYAGNEPGYVGMLVTSGILQTAGVTMLAVAAAIPEVEVYRAGSAMPALGVGAGTLTATWAF